MAALAPLAACDWLPGGSNSDRRESAREFPRADRPVAPIVSTRYASEEARDRAGEATEIMKLAGVKPGMTVADIGAGEGYYTVRLAERVGKDGRVLAEDIVAEVIDALGQRINREAWDNVSVRLGAPDNPRLPNNSFDRIFLVHMYHEIEEPYAFLWHMRPALKPDGEVIVVDADRPTEQHGTPPRLLRCEFTAVGYQLVSLDQKPTAGGYVARFRIMGGRPRPEEITPCALARD
ncbi:MAG: class I SAM-dependent methyltransferase [Sphingobium sp.]